MTSFFYCFNYCIIESTGVYNIGITLIQIPYLGSDLGSGLVRTSLLILLAAST